MNNHIQDDSLRATMDTYTACEKQSGRIERRTAYATCDIEPVVNKLWPAFEGDYSAILCREWRKITISNSGNPLLTTGS